MNTNVIEKETTHELAVIVDGLEKETQQTLLENFLPLFEKAKEWETKAKALVVTDATQLTEMKQAREARLALKDIRVNADKVRKNLKEDSIRYGKAVQGVYNVIEYLIAPIETHLQEQEDFAKIAEAKRKAELKDSRTKMLSPYEIETSFYDLSNMTEEAFQQLLKNTIRNQEEKIEAQRKAEEERIAREQEEIKERERVRLENERLKAEAEAREAELQKQKEEFEAKLREENEKKEAKNQLRKQREAILWKFGYRHDEDVSDLSDADFEKLVGEEKSAFEDAEKKRIEAERAEAEAREKREAELRAEREAKLKLELELKAKQEAEAKAQREAEEKVELEASRGDKEKWTALVADLEALQTKYTFKGKNNKSVQGEVNLLLNKVISHITAKTK